MPRLLSSDEYPKRIPIGVYDATILCTRCEPQFGVWDQYAQVLLLDDLPQARLQRAGARVVGYEIDEWQYDPLKLFFVSLLWRAAVSGRPFFKRITLGPFADLALQMLKEGNPGLPDEFAVVLAKSETRFGRVILDPFLGRIDGVNYATFYLGFYMAYIKVDKRQSLAPFRNLSLAPGRPLKIVARELMEGKEVPVLQRLLKKPQNRVGPRVRARGRGVG